MTEWLANGFMLGSVIFAARNSVHTWWLGIVASLLFASVFFSKKLYADVTLMMIFLVINIFGWRHWRKGKFDAPIKKSSRKLLVSLALLSCFSALVYGSILYLHTDAYAALWDSLILTFSIPAQILLMMRRLETWWFWLMADTIAVPLFFDRELYLTALLYGGLWCNVWYGLWIWQQQIRQQNLSEPLTNTTFVR